VQRAIVMRDALILVLALWILALSGGCSTMFLELKGECVMQQWRLLNQVMRNRIICDLPPPTMFEDEVRDREEMNTNPFPDLWDFKSKADTNEPNLLEGEMGYPQDDPD